MSTTTDKEIEAPVAASLRDLATSCTPTSSSTVIPNRRLLFRIDLHILPILSFVYLFSFLDRVNIGNAAVFGIKEELRLKGTQYNTALMIFFIPYILFEIPSNILLQKSMPHRYLSFCVLGFGVTTLLQGFVTNYAGLLATRFFLGLFETGLFPGCFYLLSMWYKRTESQKRFTFFFISTTLAMAFGGLLAGAIGKMDGYGGKRAWRWIFILEGAMTCAVAALGYFTIPDFPEDVTWLRPEEKEWVRARLHEDVGKASRKNPIRLKDLKMLYQDYKFILGALLYLGFAVSAYGYAYFAPTLLVGWNYSPIESQLRTVPIAMSSFVLAMVVAWASDYTKHRYTFILGGCLLTLAGFAMLMTTHGNQNLQYAALFIAFQGAGAAMPIAICYFQTNLAGHTRRAIGSAFQISLGNLGGVIAAFLFVPADAPEYTTGYSVAIGFVVLTIVAATAYMLGIRRENALREMGAAGVDPDDDDADVGDTARTFRYVL
ncbi:major facilitator superfamily domain-containing protein [Tricharina praecox]|uniref:major facilitator superfamily domain-containing protein n=1 Tax=Tricharina praecox TaxID=43433 RepID=UPI00221F20DB|nr:major facilitator superfamily domain-containing protein [Tricharina praecox]KAI5856058.1 major facilitator superfamily domain-containing protein [Tricharina praecox]